MSLVFRNSIKNRNFVRVLFKIFFWGGGMFAELLKGLFTKNTIFKVDFVYFGDFADSKNRN